LAKRAVVHIFGPNDCQRHQVLQGFQASVRQ
jgi:hypothetical protein